MTGRETWRQEERCTVRANPQMCREPCRAIEVGKITGIQTYLLTGREMYRQAEMLQK
jgi:hypothetical protein